PPVSPPARCRNPANSSPWKSSRNSTSAKSSNAPAASPKPPKSSASTTPPSTANAKRWGWNEPNNFPGLKARDITARGKASQQATPRVQVPNIQARAKRPNSQLSSPLCLPSLIAFRQVAHQSCPCNNPLAVKCQPV